MTKAYSLALAISILEPLVRAAYADHSNTLWRLLMDAADALHNRVEDPVLDLRAVLATDDSDVIEWGIFYLHCCSRAIYFCESLSEALLRAHAEAITHFSARSAGLVSSY